MKERIIVTSALPYANGPIHFGHIAGAYLPADIFVRFKRLEGADIIYICGTDEHGVPITLSAEKEGISPKEYVDKYHKVIRNIFDKFNIEFDNFSRTTIPIHYDLAQDFFLNLLKKNLVKPNVSKQFYCDNCKKFLADRYVRGVCPKCGAEDVRGDECTKCGSWLDVMEIRDPKCGICGNNPEIRETKHWYLQLPELSDKLEEWLNTKKYWKENVRTFVKSMIREGLKERAITRDLNWGVPLPLDDTEGKVLYVWFDAPIGYISLTKEWALKIGKPDEWEKYWLSSDTKVIHFIGKDNIPFHCIVWPALIMGQDYNYNLPYDVPANEFYNLEGRQFSKSAGWYIDIDDFFSKYSVDSIRYAIAANAPETKDSEFTWRDFQLRNNSELANIYGNLVNRTLTFINKYFNGNIPEFNEMSENSKDILKKAHKIIDTIHDCYNNYEVRRACFFIMELGRLGNKFYDYEMPWKTRKENIDKCKETMAICTKIISYMAYISYPVIPSTAKKLWRMLGYKSDITMIKWDKIKGIKPYGNRLKEVHILFERIEDKVIEMEIKNLHDRAKNVKKLNNNKDGGFINIDDFKKINIKIVEIREADRIKKSKKLIKLKVFDGERERQVVAGIAEYYSPESLIGKRVLMVVNLKPVKIMGELSEGMLLAAKDSNNLSLLISERDIDIGADIS